MKKLSLILVILCLGLPLFSQIVIECPDDKSFCDMTPDCQGKVELLLLDVSCDCVEGGLEYNYTIDFNNDDSVDVESNGNDASGMYAYGTHKIVWTVTDNCDAEETCEYLFTIKDCKKPVPVCIAPISLPVYDMGANESIELLATGLLEYAFDNCTDDSILEANVKMRREGTNDELSTSLTFSDCEFGTQIIEIWVTDEAGNSDYCTIYVIIDGDINGCPDTDVDLFEDILVKNLNGENIEKVGLYYGTDEETIHAEKNDHWLNGVTTYDAILLLKHILTVEELTNPYLMIAADVTNDGLINVSDIIALRRMILYVDSSFKNNKSWRFIDADFEMPSNPFNTDFPEYIATGSSAGFIGVKVGDLDVSASLKAVPENVEYAKKLDFSMKNRMLEPGHYYKLEFDATEFSDINGFQFTLEYDPSVLSFINITGGAISICPISFGAKMHKLGYLTCSWDVSEAESADQGDVLFTILFEAKKDALLSDVFDMTNSLTIGESYMGSNKKGTRLIFDNDLILSNGSIDANFNELFQNAPNPFINETTISFNLDFGGFATLTFYDVSGKELKVVSDDFKAGINQVIIDKTDLPAGMIYYRLDADNFADTKKMILVE